MSPGYLQIDREERPQGSICRLTIERAERLNVVDSTMLNDLESALAQIAADERARVVVLCAAGTKAWIAGADIHDMVNLDPQSAVDFIQRLHRVCAGMRELPVPVVARIDGYCLGAGLELAASCDLRVASTDSHFGMPEVQLGIPSVIEAALLPRLIGAGRARDLVLTGRVLNADEALSWGLVEALVPRAGLDALVEERVGQILSAGPRAIRQQKMLCRQWEELPLVEAIAESTKAFSRAFESDEPRTRMEQFLRKRKRS